MLFRSASAAQQKAAALQAAGLGMGTLGAQGQQLSLNDINALATLGGQQQTIAQNQQNYPLTTLTSLAGLLQGYNVPTTTSTSLDMSPLSGLAAVGSGIAGLFSPTSTGAGTTTNLWNQLTSSLGLGNLNAGIKELTNNALPGDANWGFRLFSDGTSIGPDGTYYINGQAITGPGGVPLDTGGDQTNTSDTGTPI